MATVLARSKVLDELHSLREKMTEETKNLSREEAIKYWNDETNKVLLKDGYRYVKSQDGCDVLGKI